MEFNYRKDDNHKLFKSLEENSSFGIEKPQNYIPIYNCYFSLNQGNYKHIGLNNKLRLDTITSQETNNIFNCIIKDDISKDIENRKTYLKFSPLLDPLKYLLGKYDIEDKNLFNLPILESVTDSSGCNINNCNPKINHYNNTAYVDSFFTYLTSQLYHTYGFLNGVDFYGSFLAIKNDFRINIIDDIDYLNESVFFRKNDKILYELEHINVDSLNKDTRNYRKKIIIENNESTEDASGILNLSDICNIDEIDTIVAQEENYETNVVKDICDIEITNLDIESTLNDNEKTKLKSEKSSCSSRTSNTSGSCNDNNNNSENDECDSDECDDDNGSINENDSDYENCSDDEVSEEDGDDELIAKIKSFPVQVISLEYCENTLDDLMNKGGITDEIWDSIVMQVLLSLITFQNTFHLTHNDLHTNNIMYSKTDKKYLYYKINHIYYKVPTYGKIYKIIDFGRAIYKFRGQILCSDSFAKDGDAATQYNCEPYFNNKKPRLDPSYSFDLCRLGCALYDYLIDEPQTKITQIMLEWVKDDKGRNILYKKNGDERYPDFKLYKMISRTVSKHTPANVLQKPYFDKFIVKKKDIKKNTKIMDIDSIPCCV